MLPNRLEVQLRGASARLACGADVGSAAGRLVTSEYAVNGASCLRCPDVAKVQSIQMSEDTDNIAVEENVDKHLQKDLNMEENQNIIETLRGKVREKLKNAKTEVSLDEGLLFFILSGEEDSTLGQSAEQRSVNDSYHKHFSLGDNLQNFAEGRDGDFMEEVIFLDLLEVKAADYEDDQEQVKKQQANIFVPSNSPVINQLKLPKDMMPRILEEEGFYVHRKPEIYKKTCNKMENRLLKLEEGKCWFEESGEIVSLPSPVRRSWNFRLNISKEPLNPALKTIYRKRTLILTITHGQDCHYGILRVQWRSSSTPLKSYYQGFPGGAVVKNPPANA
ncbi:protein CC2D2B homolog isoform 2-T2 [Megaptera novaeangliae]